MKKIQIIKLRNRFVKILFKILRLTLIIVIILLVILVLLELFSDIDMKVIIEDRDKDYLDKFFLLLFRLLSLDFFYKIMGRIKSIFNFFKWLFKNEGIPKQKVTQDQVDQVEEVLKNAKNVKPKQNYRLEEILEKLKDEKIKAQNQKVEEYKKNIFSESEGEVREYGNFNTIKWKDCKFEPIIIDYVNALEWKDKFNKFLNTQNLTREEYTKIFIVVQEFVKISMFVGVKSEICTVMINSVLKKLACTNKLTSANMLIFLKIEITFLSVVRRQKIKKTFDISIKS